MSASPRPWSISQGNRRRRADYLSITKVESVLGISDDIANARLIHRMVNTYDARLDALKFVAEHFGCQCPGGTGADDGHHTSEFCIKINEALKDEVQPL